MTIANLLKAADVSPFIRLYADSDNRANYLAQVLRGAARNLSGDVNEFGTAAGRAFMTGYCCITQQFPDSRPGNEPAEETLRAYQQSVGASAGQVLEHFLALGAVYAIGSSIRHDAPGDLRAGFKQLRAGYSFDAMLTVPVG